MVYFPLKTFKCEIWVAQKYLGRDWFTIFDIKESKRIAEINMSKNTYLFSAADTSLEVKFLRFFFTKSKVLINLSKPIFWCAAVNITDPSFLLSRRNFKNAPKFSMSGTPPKSINVSTLLIRRYTILLNKILDTKFPSMLSLSIAIPFKSVWFRWLRKYMVPLSNSLQRWINKLRTALLLYV